MAGPSGHRRRWIGTPSIRGTVTPTTRSSAENARTHTLQELEAGMTLGSADFRSILVHYDPNVEKDAIRCGDGDELSRRKMPGCSRGSAFRV